MLLQNTRTGEELNISLEEFRKKFKFELSVAVSSYARTFLVDSLYMPYNGRDFTDEFFFDLRWNFNNNSNSAWKIMQV